MNEDTTPVTIHPDAALLAAVDQWADQHELTRDEALLHLIQRGLDNPTFHTTVSGSVGSVTHVGDVQGDLHL
ncbi:hypothetical protein FB384_004883 [Prauserella sediminis]|uniref:Uncharacterized protein n=1 Tax=Prauserella sediminis TaxID=577680 RepID=A0A839XX39_9PSEU|nr:hypothetical protein [Prauserella sediminis]MBB3665924.1 hypothetical protein [Prauserella sediminis]